MNLILRKFVRAEFLCGPAMWVSSSPQAVIHRRMLIGFRPSRNRLTAMVNAGLCLFAWYGVIVWWSIISHVFISIKKGKGHSVLDVFYLVLWVGARSSDYRKLNLIDYPKSEWLSFVYSQEQRYWHTIQDRSSRLPDVDLLHDKRKFSSYCGEHEISAVHILDVWGKGKKLSSRDLFKGQNYFIKPMSLNAMRGCMSLSYENRRYSLQGWLLDKRRVSETDHDEILSVVQSSVFQTDVLVQPLLVNHSSLQALEAIDADLETLHTIRVTSTVCSSSVVSIESAFLEVATSKLNFWKQLEIDTDEGHLNIESTRSNVELGLIDLIKPYWVDIKSLVKRAHLGLESIPIIAWDLAISESGPILVEGNRGWGVVNYQVLRQKPLLQERFLKIYLDKSRNWI